MELVECPAVALGLPTGEQPGWDQPGVKEPKIGGQWLGGFGSWGLFSEQRCFASKVKCSDDWHQEEMTLVCSL